jgi:hypothetical protein
LLPYVVGLSCAGCASTDAKPAAPAAEGPAAVVAEPVRPAASADPCAPRDAATPTWAPSIRYQAWVAQVTDVEAATQRCRDLNAGAALPPSGAPDAGRVLGPTSPGAYPAPVEAAVAALQPGEAGVLRTSNGSLFLVRRDIPAELDLRWFAWSFRGAAGAPSATRSATEAHALAQAALDGNKLGSNADDLAADTRSRGEWEHVARGQLTDPIDQALFWDDAFRVNPSKAPHFPLRLGPSEAVVVDTEAGVYLVQRRPE